MAILMVVVMVAVLSVARTVGLRAEDLLIEAYGVSVQTDVVYGQGLVGASAIGYAAGPFRDRPE